ncbi:flavin-containing monooxygenase [Acuticoccus sp.]|uniref:flavin-containing monooxygenase n=1 Tax=Acuticoccus sp. TaxID=1904378 RepID=UPI003B52481A
MANADDIHHHDAIVIGAGFSGLYALHKLRDELDLDVRVIEKGNDIGGTWYWNRYPGARCDSESYYYSYSFSPEIEQEWTWTERYPDHHEIRRYLGFVADRLDLRRGIDLSTEVLGASFDEADALWRVRTDGATYVAPILITAVGCLSAANVPAVPGLQSFAGRWYHTGAWPHEGVDLSGKRVGQVGTGSTGIQLAPAIAEEVARLTVFQRTANYSVPARNAPLTDDFLREVKANYRAIREHARRVTNGHPFDISDVGVLEVDDAERLARFEEAWRVGGLRFRAVFRDVLTDAKANDVASEFIRRKIREVVQDPDVADKLTPKDHGFATKRPPIDTNYFETFNRDNVDLVDLKAEPIEAIVPEGIRTTRRTYPLDVIIFATGFDALTGPLVALNLEGCDGLTLREAWSAGPKTYLGLMTPGFPNLFTITGPGSPSVLCNMPVALEQHVEWIADCLAHMRRTGLKRIEPTVEASEDWVAHVNEAADATLLPMASSSWYLGANVPGKPRVFMPYAGGMARYAGTCEHVADEGYKGFVLT